MEAIILENLDTEYLVRLQKDSFSEDFLINLIKRLKIEALAQEADFDESVLEIGDEIKEEWWQMNKNLFLKGINL